MSNDVISIELNDVKVKKNNNYTDTYILRVDYD